MYIKIIKKILYVIVVVLIAGVATVGSLYYIDNKAANFGKETILYIYPDTNVDEILQQLDNDAAPKSKKSIRRCFKRVGLKDGMNAVQCGAKPGRYPVTTSQPSIYVARMIVKGWQEPCNLTLSGTIRSKERLAQKISSQMMVDSTTVMDALNNEALLVKYGFTPEDVFTLFLPDTYQVYWTYSIMEILDRFKAEYDKFWTEERKQKAAKQSLTIKEVSVMASIVSGETLKSFEYPIIAGVYLNRYHNRMKLQADPTVCFCFNYELDRVLRHHLEVDSPYNTYKYLGLPPAPINVPSKACIDAVLNPQKHSYLFFCASPKFDGTHLFATTYSEHKKNAKAFQNELTIRQKAKAKQSK